MNDDLASRQSGFGAGGAGAAPEARGTNQLGMRVANERLILALIRRTPGLAKAEIARLTGLTPQATTIIVNRLEDDGLLQRQEPVRGKVGQPAIPYSLAPDGVFSAGLLVGRHGCELIIMDFVAAIRHRARLDYKWPQPQPIADFAVEAYGRLVGQMTAAQQARLCGIGVSVPMRMWEWSGSLGLPHGALEAWRQADLAGDISKRLGLPVHSSNAANAACTAETAFGRTPFGNFVYVFIGPTVGGGVVLEGRVFQGRTGNAGAIGSLPVPDLRRLKVNQLIDWASVNVLEDRLKQAGRTFASDPGADDWAELEPQLGDWIEDMAPNLAIAAVSAAAFFEIDAIVIDGAFPRSVLERIRAAVAEHVADFDRQGVTSFEVAVGSLGPDAPIIGAAGLPLMEFSRDTA